MNGGKVMGALPERREQVLLGFPSDIVGKIPFQARLKRPTVVVLAAESPRIQCSRETLIDMPLELGPGV
jgi:hypothetical protein